MTRRTPFSAWIAAAARAAVFCAIAAAPAAAGPDAAHGARDAEIANNRLLAERAAAEGFDRLPGVRSRIETRLNRLWADVYWSEVVRPSVRLDEARLLAAAPPMEDVVALQTLIAPSREAAEALRERAVGGEDFGAIIAASSTGLSASAGGAPDVVRRSSRKYPAAVLSQLFRLPPGAYSPVVETEIGFAVVRVVGGRTAEELRREWAARNRERLLREEARKEWAARKEALAAAHAVAVDGSAVAAYGEAMAGKAPLGPLLGRVAATVDGVPLLLRDVADPSGFGVAHGADTLEALIRRRVEEYAIAREAARAGLRERFPEIVLAERLLRENILAREYVRARTAGLSAGEDEMKAYYEENRERLAAPRALDLSFIETRSADRAAAACDLLSRGVPFEDVAARWSDNGEAPGGRFGWVREDRLVPELSPVRDLRPGEHARTAIRVRDAEDGGELFVIPKVNAVRESRVPAYEEVDRASLERRVTARKRADAVRRMLVAVPGEPRAADGGGR